MDNNNKDKKFFSMKKISNFFKVFVVIYIMFEYHTLSAVSQTPLTADSCKGLLFIGIACFFILCPIDASIFAKNFMSFKNGFHDKENKHRDRGIDNDF